MGIVKKNGIMIVDFALHRIDAGYDRRTAIHDASVERFRDPVRPQAERFHQTIES
ncbi:MAG: hypothetical protein LC642_07705 [Verrucomicrobiaceae bacterium]|nr:hypothetical protein [Verrucomicrobiaceae bacterium]